MRRPDIDEKKEYIVSVLEAGGTQRSLCIELNCKPETLGARLKKWGISHLKNQSRKGIPHFEHRKDVSEFLITGKLTTSHTLKLKLFESGLKERRCEVCKNTEWNNKPIPLELDHINGERTNNTLENLRILCPNCHAQTPTYKTKNRKVIKAIINDASPIKNIKCCKDCNCVIKFASTRCKSCFNKNRSTKIPWPSDTDLLELVRSNSMLALSAQLGVSDKAIIKRCKKRDIKYN